MVLENQALTPEAANAIELCTEWARQASARFSCEVYAFGSVIYLGGEQFDPITSDLDMVVLFKNDLDPTERVIRMRELLESKGALELRVLPGLQRANCVEPAVSVVPLTQLELQANIHKSGVRHFFTKNIFLDLLNGKKSLGLTGAGTGSLPDESRHALEFAQRTRNQFLAVGANGTGGIEPYDGTEPLPKQLARAAAQLAPDPREGEWYDTRFGLELVFAELSKLRLDSDELGALYRKLSIRRGGRGRRDALTSVDQLLLAEILYNLATKAPLEPIVNWRIRFVGASATMSGSSRLIVELRRLAPDVQILNVSQGSIAVRVRSSEQSYQTVARLHRLGALPRFFDVDEVEISLSDSSSRDWVYDGGGWIDRLANHISKWRMPTAIKMSDAERSLADWLRIWMQNAFETRRASIASEVALGGGIRPVHVDFVVQVDLDGFDARVAIDLTRLKNRAMFFEKVERIQYLELPVILVCVGQKRLFASLRGDIERLALFNPRIQVVPIQVES